MNFLLQMLIQESQAQHNKAKNKIYLKPEELISKAEYEKYPSQIKSVFDSIFTYQEEAQPCTFLQELKSRFEIKKVGAPSCGNYYQQQTSVYQCHSCYTQAYYNEKSVARYILCQQCFKEGDHVGHNYEVRKSSGKCDCGIKIKQFKGFCKNHNGQVPDVVFDKIDQEKFRLTFRQIFHWFFLLCKNHKQNEAKKFGQNISKLLLELNDKSYFYNVLTFKLLFQCEIDNQPETVMKNIFKYGGKYETFCANMTNLFFYLHFLDEFRCRLSEQLVIAHNTIQNFQDTTFRNEMSLFLVQQNVLSYLTKKKLILKSINKNSFKRYYRLLKFVIERNKNNIEAIQYLDNLFSEGIIQFRLLQIIQEEIQKKDKDMIVAQSLLSEQFHYYELIFIILQIGQKNKTLLKKMLQQYVKQINLKKHNQVKNKLVIPYERTLGLILFTIFQGNLENIDLQQIKTLFESPQRQNEFYQAIKTVFQQVLITLKQFSKLFILGCQTDLSQNYFATKLGLEIINIDLLTFKICALLLDINQKVTSSSQGYVANSLCQSFKNNNKVNYISRRFAFIENFELLQQSIYAQSQVLQNQLLKILLECSISKKEQIYIRTKLCIETKFAIHEMQNFWLNVCKYFNKNNHFDQGFLTKIEQIFFAENIRQKESIQKHLIFDKKEQVYHLSKNQHQMEQENQNMIPFQKMMSIKKIITFVFGERQIKSYKELKPILKNKAEQLLSQRLFSQNLLNSIIQKRCTKFKQKSRQFKDQLSKNQTESAFKGFFVTLQQVNVLAFDRSNPILLKFMQDMKSQYLKNEEKYHFLKEFFQQEKQKQREEAVLDQKKKEKKRKIDLKFKKRQEQFQTVQQNELNTQKDFQCIVCRNNSQNNFNNLCYMANLYQTNFINSITKIQGRFLGFNSCFHCIHMECFTKLVGDSPFVKCPLCKKQASIIIPTQMELRSNKQISLYIIERIQTHRQIINIYQNMFRLQAENSLFTCFMNFIVERCCFNLAQPGRKAKKNQLKLTNILYLMTKKIYESYDFKRKQEHIKMVEQYLEDLHHLQICRKKIPYKIYELFAFIIQIIQCRIQNKEVNKEEQFQQVLKLFSKNELEYCWNWLQNVFEISIQKFQQSNCELQLQKTVENKNQLRDLFQLFEPPKNISQLIELRDLSESKCSKNHQEVVCILCQWKGCHSCKQGIQHNLKHHLGKGLLFNIFTGEIIEYDRQSLAIVSCVYSNQHGRKWTHEKGTKGFQIDSQIYNKMVEDFLSN